MTAAASNHIPPTMRAAVYRGKGLVAVEEIATPRIGPGELLVRVESCGICHTDLKKIEYGLQPPPRVYGHETAGMVVAVGGGAGGFAAGDRVAAFHHVPCQDCFYCRRRLYAQCAGYLKVGITAGFEPAGGGFSEYVCVKDWIVRRGVEKIPEGVSYDRASFVEPVNTCLKAVHQAALDPEDTVLILGQGPIGLIFTMLVRHKFPAARIVTTDTIAPRRELSLKFGANASHDPRQVQVDKEVAAVTHGRGADAVLVCVSAPRIVEQAVRASRPGSRILLFAQTSDSERIELSGADICKQERVLYGVYSADLDLQSESARLVFGGHLPVEDLISHRLTLEEIRSGIEMALHPDSKSLKIIVQPPKGRQSE